MNDLADQLAAVLGEEGFDDSDKLESVRTILYNRSRPATPEESKAAWADLCRSAGIDPEAKTKPEPLPHIVSGPASHYYGSKYLLAPWILEHFPLHHCYVEPFGGAASVLLRKQPSPLEVYNDLEGSVVNFFSVLRDHTDDLLDRIAMTPWSRQEYLNAFAPTNHAVEWARRFWVIHQQSIAATPCDVGWRCTTDQANRMPEFADRNRVLGNLRNIALRLRSIQIECRPASEVIRRFDAPDTLFYVDPPYPHRTRTKTKRYLLECTDDQHRELAQTLHQVTGKVIISGYRCDLYDDLYRNWRRVGKVARGNSGSRRTESLWLSF
jgi:DNA adenine methylase